MGTACPHGFGMAFHPDSAVAASSSCTSGTTATITSSSSGAVSAVATDVAGSVGSNHRTSITTAKGGVVGALDEACNLGEAVPSGASELRVIGVHPSFCCHCSRPSCSVARSAFSLV